VQNALGNRPIERRDRDDGQFLNAFGAFRDATAELGDLRLDGRLDRPVALRAESAALRVFLCGGCVSQG
jgi:hypothetical protein